MDAGVKMTPMFHFYNGEAKVKALQSTSASELEVRRFLASRVTRRSVPVLLIRSHSRGPTRRGQRNIGAVLAGH